MRDQRNTFIRERPPGEVLIGSSVLAGRLIVELSACVPDGMVVFFP